MARHRLLLATLMFVALLPALAARSQIPAALNAPVPQATSENARDVLARVHPSVIQIKGFFGTNTAHEFHGSGFAVKAGGVFMTNYHVVARKVQHPSKYRLEYRTPEGKTGALAVLGVDVRHDLALVRAEDHAPVPLPFVSQEPARGARAYSVGFPLDVGLTITEGVSNGKVEESYEPRIHYSGAINGGMSGGPALDAAGDVIGVNVSHYRFQQSVSFLVPAQHAVALVAQAPTTLPTPEVIEAQIGAQVRDHASRLIGALSGPIETQTVAGYALPGRLAAFVSCSGSGNPDDRQPVQIVRVSCQTKAGLYVQAGLQSGDITFSHTVLSTEKLDAWRFAHRLSGNASSSGSSGQRRHLGPYACNDRTVALNGFDAALTLCTRSYRKLVGLYDFYVTVRSLTGMQHGFSSRLVMTGIEFDPALAFIRRYVGAMAWKP